MVAAARMFRDVLDGRLEADAAGERLARLAPHARLTATSITWPESRRVRLILTSCKASRRLLRQTNHALI
jgi:hypothetical protein